MAPATPAPVAGAAPATPAPVAGPAPVNTPTPAPVAGAAPATPAPVAAPAAGGADFPLALTVATSSTMMSGDADSVAMSGGLIVIGNSYYSNYRGLVSIYRASDGVLLKQFSGSGSNDYLGYSVAIDGDTVVAGAWEWPNEGFAKVYRTPDGGDTWTTAATLTASDGAKNDYFGRSVAVAGDTIFVGGLR